MSNKITTRKITWNLIMSITAQLLSLVTSFVVGFIVPKFIDEYQYAYWQTFLLYLNYVGIFHFGLLDGLVLKYSQYNYEQLDKVRFRSQFQILLCCTSIIFILSCIISSLFLDGISFWIVILVSIGIIVRNIFTYTSYIFQITNRIGHYAVLVITQRLVYAILVIILLLARVNDFYWYCIADLAGDLLGILFGSFFNKGLYFGKSLSIKESFKEAFQNIGAGIFLRIASLTSGLILSCAKMVTQWRWGDLIFGKVSFAFSVYTTFLSFSIAISIVLFPSLKRMKEEELPDLYKKIRGAISPLLFFVMIVYFPMCWILKMWLPKYTESLAYLGVLLPIIIFSSKENLLTNNYLKAYRKEKTMLFINVGCVILGMLMVLLCAYLWNDLDLLLYSVVLISILRSIISEIVVLRIIGQKAWFDFIVEIAMTIVFVVAARYFSLWIGCLIYAVALVVYSIVYRKNLMVLIGGIGKILRRKTKKEKQ